VTSVVSIGQTRTPAASLIPRIEAAHLATRDAVLNAVARAVECGHLLLEAKAKVGHGNWIPWIEKNLSLSVRQVQKYMRLAEHLDPNAPWGTHLTINEALAEISEKWEPPSATVTSLHPSEPSHVMRVTTSSASPEWCTPTHIVERVTATLGEIDLDPCWHPASPVQAETTYTVEDDGLLQDWKGRCYVNPPYGREIGEWIEKLVADHEAGAVSEAIALVPARVDTEWFRLLDPYPRCFIYGRLTFGDAENSAPFPSAAVYLGPNLRRFIQEFGSLGSIFTRINCLAQP
jgi:hypothetical protein